MSLLSYVISLIYKSNRVNYLCIEITVKVYIIICLRADDFNVHSLEKFAPYQTMFFFFLLKLIVVINGLVKLVFKTYFV